MWNWLKSRSYQESRALMEFSVVQTDPTVYPVLSNFQRSEENLQVRVRGRSKCWVGLDYVSPTFRLVRFMVEKTATSPVGCVLERRGRGQVWDFLIGTHQKNTSVMQARFLKRQAGRVGVGVKAKRGPMAEEGSTRGSRKVQQFWGLVFFTVCVPREMGKTARTEIAGGYSRFHAQYDRPAFGFHENHYAQSRHPASRLPVTPTSPSSSHWPLLFLAFVTRRLV